MRSTRLWHFVLVLMCGGYVWVTMAQAAEPQTFSAQSPAHTVALLELYTSEG
ncbi:MAG: hypothetical protein V3U27_07485 [Candidatus Tectomicrobia bacterium]